MIPIDTAIPAILNFPRPEMLVGRNYPFENIATNTVFTAAENSNIQQERADLYCVGFVSCVDAADENENHWILQSSEL